MVRAHGGEWGTATMLGFLVAVLAYLGGSIPMGYLVGRWAKGVDVRRHGSGNIGATNVLRTLGAGWAILVFAFDAAKGAAPIVLAQRLGLGPLLLAVVALSAVAGHNWSVFLRFRGGKGVATSLGVLLALAPWSAIAVAVIWVFIVAVTGFASVGSLVGLAASGPILGLLAAPWPLIALGGVLFVLGAYQHRGNIKRLLQGKELPIFGPRRNASTEGRNP